MYVAKRAGEIYLNNSFLFCFGWPFFCVGSLVRARALKICISSLATEPNFYNFIIIYYQISLQNVRFDCPQTTLLPTMIKVPRLLARRTYLVVHFKLPNFKRCVTECTNYFKCTRTMGLAIGHHYVSKTMCNLKKLNLTSVEAIVFYRKWIANEYSVGRSGIGRRRCRCRCVRGNRIKKKRNRNKYPKTTA